MGRFINPNLSSPTPLRPSSPIDFDQRMGSLSLKESNENTPEPHTQMGSDLQNLKQSTPKHFMSPTVSAALKASFPRKKILVERNEDFDTHLHKTPPIAADGYSTQINPLSDSNNSYDPLTNYLSPRPKFLRYNPNRRVEILHRRETEFRKRGHGVGRNRSAKSVDEESAFDSSQSSSAQEGSRNQEGESGLSEENLGLKHWESEDDEDEEVEEEAGYWYLNKVLKFLLLLVVLIFSTSYISTMNTPTTSPALQNFWGVKERYQKIQNHLFGTVLDDYGVGWSFLEQNEGKDENFIEVYEKGVSEPEMEKPGKELEGVSEPEMEKPEKDLEGISEPELEEPGKGLEEIESENAEISYPDIWMSIENPRVFEKDVKSDEEEHAEMVEPELVPSDDEQVENLKGFEEISDKDMGVENLSISETEMKSVGEEHEEVVGAEPEMGSSIEPVRDEGILAIPLEVNELPSEELLGNEGNGKEEMVENEAEKVVEAAVQGTKEEMCEPIDILWFESIKNADESICSDYHEDSEVEKASLVSPLGICALSVVGIMGLLRMKSRKSFAKKISPATRPSLESTVVEDNGLNGDSSFPMKEKVAEEPVADRRSYIDPSFPVHSEVKVSLEPSRVPTVELLGEYVVGRKVSSFVKRSNLKPNPIESEQSNFSLSEENRRGRPRKMSPAVANQSQRSNSELSATESYSYGRVDLQERKDGEDVTRVIPAPVRRSSRIRSRAVMSP